MAYKYIQQATRKANRYILWEYQPPTRPQHFASLCYFSAATRFANIVVLSFLAAVHPQRLGCQKGNLNNGASPDKPTCIQYKYMLVCMCVCALVCVAAISLVALAFLLFLCASLVVNCIACSSCTLATTLMKAKISSRKKLVQQQ